MKLITLGALVAFATAGASAQARTDQTSLHQTLHFAGSGAHTLEVRAVTGSITIEGYDGKDIEVLVNKTVTSETVDDRAAAEREVKLDTNDNSDRISLVVKYEDRPMCGEKHVHWDGWDRHDYEVRY